MRKSSTHLLAIVLLGAFFVVAWSQASRSADVAPEERRPEAQQQMQQGNFKDAYELYREITLSDQADPMTVGDDLRQAVQCLQRINRTEETDAYIEEVIAQHNKNWRLLWAAAETYMGLPHQGFMIAGEFRRGPHRGGGKVVNSIERDRVRALQLMNQAIPLAVDDPNTRQVSDFYLQLGNILLNNRGFYESWRLQYLTDLETLPDYEDGWQYHRGYNGAPVDAEGNPVFHEAPRTWEQSETDGQRWRYALQQAVEYVPDRLNRVRVERAQFLWQQFGVQTMAQFGGFFPRRQQEDDKADTGTFAVSSLKDNETIARLATGIKRFELPDEHNFLKLYEAVADDPNNTQYVRTSLHQLGQVYMNRRQYPRAADWYRDLVKRFGQGQEQLNQIVDNWGRFEPISTQAAGQGATVEYRFRNGKDVELTAWEIKVPELLDDVKDYLRNNQGGRLDWNQHNVGNLGYRLVHQNENKYRGKQVAQWKLELAPRPAHVDSRVTVNTPLQKPGAYLLRADMQDGNVSNIIVWVADTAIVKKPLSEKMYYYVGDAVDGSPIDGATLDMFGFRQRYLQNNRVVVDTIESTLKTNADGEAFATQNNQPNNYQWLITATKGEERFAYLGWTGVWYGNYHDQDYNAVRVFPITDRPVYRPEQKVHYKLWVRRSQYDQAETSQFANQKFPLRIYNPKGEKIVDTVVTSDEFGGIEGELELPKDAVLGVYRFNLERDQSFAGKLLGGGVPVHGGGTFRVEEYKKPEFEVTVDAPSEPVMLGEQIEATIKAKYYFGSPVTGAKVKYKIFRDSHTQNWYPHDPWDWLYGRGYWWFGQDYNWYPGFRHWGCVAPLPWWWQGQRHTPPELVAEVEAPIEADGTVKVMIDTTAAKEMHGDLDHSYRIEAEVTDQSRRTIVGSGNVLVARKPFKVTAWTNQGYFRVGDTIEAQFHAHTLDNRPVVGAGELKLFAVEYADGKPVEQELRAWDLPTGDDGNATQKMIASRSGQYRLSYTVTDKKGHEIEGGYIFTIIGDEFDGSNFQFNALEMVPNKRNFNPGESVNLQVNTDQNNSTVLLFVRPSNGIYINPKVVRVKGKSFVDEIPVIKKDMPNFYIEAITISNGKLHQQTQEIVVPPVKRIVDIEILPNEKEYLPGDKAKVKLKLTDYDGAPLANGSTVVAVYDKSLEYISGGSNVPDIKEFFWSWKRHHHANTEHSLARSEGNLTLPNKPGMGDLGVFGRTIVEEFADDVPQDEAAAFGGGIGGGGGFGGGRGERQFAALAEADGLALADSAAPGGNAPAAKMLAANADGDRSLRKQAADKGQGGAEGGEFAETAVRSNFADTAFWAAALETDENGHAEVEFDMPENLSAWNIKVWGMGHGTSVGEGAAEVVTRKNLIVRLQAPRFFVETDEVVLSANVHNYLENEKQVQVRLEMEGEHLEALDELVRTVTIPAGGEQRVDWRVKVVKEGEVAITMKALSDEESDAMQMKFPVYVHGMDKMESYSNSLRPEDASGSVEFTIPEKRRIEQTRLEIRYSPTLAGAMVDALPYMVDYPYGCTEQTLNRFVPTVIVQNILQEMNLDLEAIREKQTNLNAQELGDAQQRAQQWKRFDRNPVFSKAEVDKIVRDGVDRLQQMQNSDGGWGWFSGFGEQSYPHTTAVVVHGLQVARQNDVALPAGMLEQGIAWLQAYQAQEVQKIKNAPAKTHPWKPKADNLDAFVFMVLVDGDVQNEEMLEFLYRDRVDLSVYAKAMYGLALHSLKQDEKLDMILDNISQFVVEDDENQTAWLNLPQGYWWYWYGSENEAMAYYLKLLSRTEPKGKRASRLVKYMLNNRKHATYWNSTRDTALCIEAMAEYMRASGESKPNMTVEVWLNGELKQAVEITPETLFQFDNSFVLSGDEIASGKHTVELRKKGEGPLYFNTYVSYFTLEDFITKAGLEIKVERAYYKLEPVEATDKVAGSRGQVIDQKVEKYERVKIENMDELTSGDLVEIELTIDSKNDYEYLLFEDMKAAGFEPVEVRSGYGGNEMGAYMELRDNRVAFFVRQLARGKHSISYRMRAEIPGKFSALPTRASAMYAPELRANSDELKVKIKDAPLQVGAGE